MRGCRLLYFVKSKNGTKCKNFAVLLPVFLCQYIHSFILPEMAGREGGATAPLATPLNPPLSFISLTRGFTKEWRN